MKNTKSNITVSPKGYEFIPFAKVYPEPTFNVRKAVGKQWIQFGENDDLPTYVNGLIDKSADHAAIVNGTIQYVIGNGLVPPTDAKAKAMFLNGEESLTTPNDLGEISKKIARDIVVHGGCLLNVRWSRDKTQIADVHYVDVASMRIDSAYEGYWLSKDWTNVRKNTPEFFPEFNTEAGGSQLLYIKAPSARSTPYALPAYWSAREAIDLQASMMRFNLKRVNNNFQVSAVITYDDAPTPEEQDKMHKALKDFTTGPDGEFTGGFLQTYGGGVTVTPFSSGSGPKDFEWISEFADQRIRAAHRVVGNGDIFGLARGNETGFNSADLETEFETYSQTVVRPLQNTLLGIWNLIAKINGIDHTWEIDPFVLFDAAPIDGEGKKENSLSSSSSSDETVAPVVEDVQATALNGAQVDSLVGIITAVSEGKLTAATAKPLIQAAFPAITEAQIDAMLGGIEPSAPIIPPDPNPIIPNGN